MRLLTRGGEPAWSPDGHWIAFEGPYGDIYVIGLGGTGRHRVAKASPDQTQINIDPDKDRVAP